MKSQSVERLRRLRLSCMADKLQEMSQSPKLLELPWADAVAMLVDAEYDSRNTRRLQLFLKKARLKYPQACLQEMHYEAGRNLKKESLRELSDGQFIALAHNVLISGPTGTGKSYLACALGTQACLRGYRTSYYRMNLFLESLSAEKAMGQYAKAIEKLRKVQLLILDDLNADVLSREQRQILFDVVEERYTEGSVILTSQVPVEKWHEVIGERSAAEGICDRLFHHCYRFSLQGASKRRK